LGSPRGRSKKVATVTWSIRNKQKRSWIFFALDPLLFSLLHIGEILAEKNGMGRCQRY
jgi:hypothetical protein